MAKMTKDEAYAYLDSKPGWLILTTIDSHGFPHSIPAAYFRMGDEIYTGGHGAKSRIKNLQRNPKVSALIESGVEVEDLKGLMIQGDADVITDRQEVLALVREDEKQQGTPEDQLSPQVSDELAYTRIRPRRFVSWDNTRLG